MKRTAALGLIAAITVCAATLTPAADERKAKELIQSGKNEETVGNLKGAIALYEKAVSEADARPAVAAEALLQLGKAYQKKDDERAVAIFSRIAEKYPKESPAAEANRRLSALRNSRSTAAAGADSPRLILHTLLEEERISEPRVSVDGRYLIYVDRDPAGGLAIRDLRSGTARIVVHAAAGEIESPAISVDGKRVAYARRDASTGNYDLRLVNTDGSRDHILLANNEISYQPKDWTPGGQILALLSRKNRGTLQVSLVDASTGFPQPLTTFGSREPGNLTLSPDGRFVAFDFQQENSARDIVIADIEGGYQERKLAAGVGNHHVLGWSPDGRWLLYQSDGDADFGVWAIDALEKTTAGRKPMLISAQIGSIRSLGVTRDGTLVFHPTARAGAIRSAESIPQELARLQLAGLQRPQQVNLSSASVEGVVVKLGSTDPISDVDVELARLEGTSSSPLGPGIAEAYAAAFAAGGGPGTINLRRTLAPEVQNTRTGKDGRFLFRNLKPGAYRLVASGTDLSLFPAEYGQRDPKGRGLTFPIREGDSLRDMRLEMAPLATIAGNVLSPNAEPIGRASVMALYPDYVSGRKTLRIYQIVLSDDRGGYRLQVPPGTYYVGAKTIDSPTFQTFSPPPGTSGGALESGPPNVSHRIQPDGDVVDEVSTVAYYGSVSGSDKAQPIYVHASEIFAGADVQMTAGTRGHHIRGQLIDGVTREPLRAGMRAIPLEPAPHVMVLTAGSDDNGFFDISGVTPGRYVITSPYIQRPAGGPIIANSTVDVGDANIENLRLEATVPPTLTGRVITEGISDSSLAALAGLRVNLTRDPELLNMPNAFAPRTQNENGAVRGDGSFSLQASSGDFRIQLAGMPSDVYIKSILMSGRDIAAEGLHLTERPVNPMEIVLARAAGQLSGVAVNERQTVMSNVIVALVPESPLLRPRLDLYRTATTLNDGRFTIREIPPGDYKLFAWEYAEPNAWQNADFMRPYELMGKPIHIDDGPAPETQIMVIREARAR